MMKRPQAWWFWMFWYWVRRFLLLRGTIRVTFDTNVFQLVVRPDLFQNDIENALLWKINAAISGRRIQGYFTEPMLDLESIPKVNRASYFSAGSPKIEVKEVESEIGELGLSFSRGCPIRS